VTVRSARRWSREGFRGPWSSTDYDATQLPSSWGEGVPLDTRLRSERARGAALASNAITLANLSECFPHPAFLFSGSGALRWMSDEGVLRLSLEAARLGGGHLVRGNSALAAISGQARRALENPAHDLEGPLRRAGLIRAGECVAVRRFSEFGSTSFLIAFVPAMAPLPGVAEPQGEETRVSGLGTVESQVARLAADGYTVLNIAARLGNSESTVRTHLHRVYVKLGVHGRAELAGLLLRGRL
jgi:DNA-binding CsgD family transcriptional regulator